VAREAKARGVPIRIGANIGSLSKATLRKFGRPCAEALVESALEDVAVLEDLDFHDIVISVKASEVPMMIDAYTMIAERTPYPLHLGVTEAGTAWAGGLKSAVGIGTVLAVSMVTVLANTIRLTLYARREEIEILKLIGATPGFIKIPFVLEGALLGGGGAACSLLLLRTVFGLAETEMTLRGAFWGLGRELTFLPGRMVVALLVLGVVLGCVGSLVSLPHLRELRR
jgi:4-hydroxy-3-methylbut-2-en-1-yl diphosphate synthase IspG/GcpE